MLDRLNRVLEPLVENGTIKKGQLDTYKRELERYGDHSFEEMETIFFADSVAVDGILDIIEGDDREHYRWLYGIRGVDMMLTNFGLKLEGKKELMIVLRRLFQPKRGG